MIHARTVHQWTRAARSRKAFTLVEVLMASAVGAIVMGGIVTTYIISLRGFRAISNYTEIHADGRYAMDKFARDMRAVNDIASFTASSYIRVTIPTNFTSSGAVSGVKTITYSYSSGSLYRTDSSGGGMVMLTTNILSFALNLFDKAGNTTTVTSSARGIQLDMTLRKRVVSQQQTEDFLTARLIMRNKL